MQTLKLWHVGTRESLVPHPGIEPGPALGPVLATGLPREVPKSNLLFILIQFGKCY